MTTGTRVIRKSTGQLGTVASLAFLMAGSHNQHYAVLVDFNNAALLTAVPVEELVTVSDKASQDKATSESNDKGKLDTALIDKLEQIRLAVLIGRNSPHPDSAIHITLALPASQTIRDFLSSIALKTLRCVEGEGREGAGDGK